VHYFLNDTTGGWMSVSGDIDVLNIVPDGYREVDEAEFNAAAGVVTLPAPGQPPAAPGGKTD
jgi:hypothetical protein